jgi:hypothetical protein
MQYASKLKAYPSNPAYDCVFNPLYENVYDKQPNTIFKARSIALASALKIELPDGNRAE